VPTIATDRLFMRPYREQDFEAVHAYARLIDACRFMAWGPNEPAHTRDFLGRVIAGRSEEPRLAHEFAVVRRVDRLLIGGIGLNVRQPEDRGAELGYVISPDHWGRGYAIEITRALVAFGFLEVGLHRVSARVDPENAGSIRVLEKLGMRCEGHLVRTHRIRGEWRDHLIYAVLEDEWGKPPAD